MQRRNKIRKSIKSLIALVLVFLFTGSYAYSHPKIFKGQKDDVKDIKLDIMDTVIPPAPKFAPLPAFTTIYRESLIKISSINPTQKNNKLGLSFPGLRGANQLVIYTPEYGFRTSTNEFGAEAIVVNDTIVELSGADSIIPSGGYVISGHGSAKKWMNENLSIGTKVYVDVSTNTLRSFVVPESFTFNAESKIKEVLDIVDYYDHRSIYYDDKRPRFYARRSKDAIKKAEKNPNEVQQYAKMAISDANLALEYALPYYEDELKGTWIRPTEKTPEAIKKTLDNIKSTGINNVFLETYFHGKTIYPSNVMLSYGVTNQREEFKGFDPLAIWVSEAHKRNMKVHIWFESFYVGNDYQEANPFHVLNAYPEWGNKTLAKYDSQIPVPSASEHNGYFIDPANPEVQKYLISILTEIITKYKPDGINLDYIRYPQSIVAKYNGYENSNWGYTEYTRLKFKAAYGIDPIDIKKNTPEWDMWAEYRQDAITDFVAKVRNLTQNYGVTLTAVIFPDRQRSLETKMQDWSLWSLNNYVDGFTPLILTCDKNTAEYLIKDIKKNSSPRTKIYPGLFITFMGGSKDDLLRQIHVTRKLNSAGVILFDYAHINQNYASALSKSVFNPNTVLCSCPDNNKLEHTCAEQQKNKKKKEKRNKKHSYSTSNVELNTFYNS